MLKQAITARLANATAQLEAINHLGWTLGEIPAQFAGQQEALVNEAGRCKWILARRYDA